VSSTKGNGKKIVRFGCIGIRGYGSTACELLARHHIEGVEGIQFVAACDPAPGEIPEAVDRLRELGVKIVRNADELLAQDLDAVWLPLPIHLHKEFTIAALESGKAVVCEKPAAGCVQDVDAMIVAQKKADLPVIVGFQHLFDPGVLAAKNALVGGRLGDIKRAVVYGCWPRTKQYYSRTDWAGRKSLGRRVINDNPASNAMSHFIMLALYLLGPTAGSAAEVKSVKSHLYRTADIETFDTISMRITTASDIEIDIHLSHASRTVVTPTVTVHASNGRVCMTDGKSMVIQTGGDRNLIPWDGDSRHHIAPSLARIMRGDRSEHQASTLENARQHVRVCELASSCAAVVDISPRLIKRGVVDRDGENAVITDLEIMISDCVRNGRLLTDLSKLP
jgi:predicted dehydrogenase